MRKAHMNPHGGDGPAVAAQLGIAGPVALHCDFSVNVNPLGPPSSVARALAAAWNRITAYPQVDAAGAEHALAEAHGVPPGAVIVGNGSTEILSWILSGLGVRQPAQAVPCYAGYAEACATLGLDIRSMPLNAENGFRFDAQAVSRTEWDCLFIGSPNNPTGTLVSREVLLSLAADHPARWIVVDESFMDFVPDPDRQSLIATDLPANLLVLKSLTKFFAIPGLRLGMACGDPATLARLRKVRLPWTVNACAQDVAAGLYRDEAYLAETRQAVPELRAKLAADLECCGMTVLESAANFFLARLPEGETASALQKRLLGKGILVRSCANFEGLGEPYCRFAVRPLHEQAELIRALGAPGPADERTKSLMVVGTMSDSGKSVIAAALCRLFARRGVRVLPFKAQNMSLNSFVTPEGGEMGRAQVVQAQAAGVTPHTDMNPILLKPMGEAGSQVIVDGRAIGNVPAVDYYEMKDRMREAAHAAYDRLAARCDLVVLEGAGSPAEINLQDDDIVNMSMAEYADASVILVADIDRGGVFASVLGTLALLPWRHRRLVRGIVINKFRGDVGLLNPGLKQIEALTGVPVLGVLPFLRELGIEDEDSVALESREIVRDALLDIAVIRLPRISNFTDFLSLERTAAVSVRYVSRTDDLGNPDLVVLPGTKHTCADLEFLHESGLADALVGRVREGVPVFGICGGYQMLGSRVVDPGGVEGEAGEVIGLNLLPVSTVLEPEKELAQVRGETGPGLRFAAAGTEVVGYEIHAGRTVATGSGDGPLRITRRRDREVDEQAGAVSADGLVFGCYLHGLFDAPEFRTQLLNWLCERKDTEPPDWQEKGGRQDEELDRLADAFAEHVDLAAIEEMIR